MEMKSNEVQGVHLSDMMTFTEVHETEGMQTDHRSLYNSTPTLVVVIRKG